MLLALFDSASGGQARSQTLHQGEQAYLSPSQGREVRPSVRCPRFDLQRHDPLHAPLSLQPLLDVALRDSGEGRGCTPRPANPGYATLYPDAPCAAACVLPAALGPRGSGPCRYLLESAGGTLLKGTDAHRVFQRLSVMLREGLV
jgi:hypothetical protein